VRSGKLDHQLVWLHLDAGDMLLDEARVIDRLRPPEVFPNRPDDHGLDFGSRYPAHRSGACGRTLQQGR
jgi:hypothetical protein